MRHRAPNAVPLPSARRLHHRVHVSALEQESDGVRRYPVEQLLRPVGMFDVHPPHRRGRCRQSIPVSRPLCTQPLLVSRTASPTRATRLVGCVRSTHTAHATLRSRNDVRAERGVRRRADGSRVQLLACACRCRRVRARRPSRTSWPRLAERAGFERTSAKAHLRKRTRFRISRGTLTYGRSCESGGRLIAVDPAADFPRLLLTPRHIEQHRLKAPHSEQQRQDGRQRGHVPLVALDGLFGRGQHLGSPPHLRQLDAEVGQRTGMRRCPMHVSGKTVDTWRVL